MTVDVVRGFPLWVCILLASGSFGFLSLPTLLYIVLRRRRSLPTDIPLWAATIICLGIPLALGLGMAGSYVLKAPDFNQVQRDGDRYTFRHTELGRSRTVERGRIKRVALTIEGSSPTEYMVWIFLADGTKLRSEFASLKEQVEGPLQQIGLTPVPSSEKYFRPLIHERWGLIVLAGAVVMIFAGVWFYEQRKHLPGGASPTGEPQ